MGGARGAGFRRAIREAAQVLDAGGIVAVPTDTVYGLAVPAGNARARSRLYEVKERPAQVELPVLVSDLEQALRVVSMDEPARRLAAAFWPGPVTLVLPSRPGPGAASGGDGGTIGVRWPAHEVPVSLCRAAGPLATTSANLHRQPTPALAVDVAQLFGEAVPLVLDGGSCTGSPSTVVDCTGSPIRCVREGAIAWERVLAELQRRAPRSERSEDH